MRILVADDNVGLLETIVQTLTGHEVRTAKNGGEAMRLIDSGTFEAIITDIDMPQGTGIDLLNHISVRKQIPTYVHSGIDTFEFYGKLWDLRKDIQKTFPFASFRLKGRETFKDILAFVDSISAQS